MQENSEQLFHNITPEKPPRGLFLRIIKRLGIEKELALIRQHLKFFATLLVVFLVLSFFAFIGFKQVLDHSSFGPFITLIFSNPEMVLKHWQSFSLSVVESMPAIYIASFLLPLALLLLFIRLAAADFEKLLLLLKTAKSVHRSQTKNISR